MSSSTLPAATQSMSPREMWLSVALAVAKGQIAHPDDFEVRPDIRCVDLLYNARTGNPLAEQQAEHAAAWLDLGNPDRAETRRVWWRVRDGWTWYVRAYLLPDEPAGGVIAAHVIEAIGAAT